MSLARVNVKVVDLSITVAAGTGSAVFNEPGKIISFSFQKPSGNPTYDFEVLDASGYGIDGYTGAVGNATIASGRLCKSTCTLTISNATVNGVYLVRIYVEGGV